jgi:Protein of unknown function (DUF3105)
MKRVLLGLVAFAVGVGGILLILVVVSGRDDAGVDTKTGAGPGEKVKVQATDHRAAPKGYRYSSFPPTSGPHRVVAVPGHGGRFTTDQLLTALEEGNVVLLHAPGKVPAALTKARASVVEGPSTPALIHAGQAVLIGTYPGTGTRTVALAWGRLLRVANPTDPRIPAFAEAWIGLGASPSS